MAPKLEQQAPAERQTSLGKADNAMATLAREYNDPNASPQQRSNDLTTLNHTFETTGVLPGMTLTDMHSTKPGDPNAPESVKLQTTDPTTGGRIIGEAQYDPQTHQLAFDRTGVLPGTQNGANEHVTVDMLTGRETVTAPGENGTTRTTTRESVGASDPTTVVTANVNGKTEVVQTEATTKNGDTATTQYHYDNTGKLTTYTPPGGQETKVPEGSTVDTKTGVLFATKPDGTKIDVTPQGRIFTTDPTGKTSYTVQPGDTLTDVATDLAKVNGNLTPSDTDIQSIVTKIGHAGVNGDPNAIRAGETINFGAGTGASGDDLNLQGAKPSDAPPAPGPVAPKPGEKWNGQTIPNGSTEIHYDHNNLVYTNAEHNQVTLDPSGAETTDVHGTKVYRHKPGEQPYKIVKDGATLEWHPKDRNGQDPGWFIQDSSSSPWTRAGGVIRVGKDGAVQYDGTGTHSAEHYQLGHRDGDVTSGLISDDNSLVRLDLN
jgi:hypothetical protein